MAQPVAAPGEAGRPVGGLPTAAPRTFPPPSPLLGAWGAKSSRGVPSATLGVRVGRGPPRFLAQKTAKEPLYV